MSDDKNEIRSKIRENYSQVAQAESGGCCGSSGCCSGDTTTQDTIQIAQNLGYSAEDLESDFAEANQGLGCGNPKAIADLSQGEVVLDLGSGPGFDVFLAAEEVGETGKVIGVDMTPEMIEKARNKAQENEVNNVEFRLGEIEHLPVADKSVDVIISNCVINLSVDKEAVFSEIYRVLKPGGRIAISDILKSNQLPAEIKDNLDNYSSCITGAVKRETMQKIIDKNNFKDIQIENKSNSEQIVKDWSQNVKVEDYIFSAYITAQKPKK